MWLSAGGDEQDALSQQGKPGASSHLPLDCLDVRHAALNYPRAPGRTQSSDDSLQIVAQIAGEAAERCKLAGLHGFDPVRQAPAFELGEHFREILDADGGLGHFGAAAQHPFAGEYLLGVEGVGVAGEQVGGLPDGRGVGDQRRCAAGGSEGLQVTTDGPGTAQVASLAEFRVELLGFGAALVPAFVQVGEIRADRRVTMPVTDGDVFDAGSRARTSGPSYGPAVAP